jgi:phosphate uptake regulator
MKRKVIQLAGKTLLVSLPSKWAKLYGINKGDEVEVEQREKSLFITTEKPAAVEKKELVLEGSDEFIRRTIGIEYKKGIEELMLKFESPKTIGIVKDAVSKAMGFEIISQGEKFCLVKSVAAALEAEFDNILRRIFLLMIEMAKNAHDAVKKREYPRLREIKTSELTNNKLTDFCKRLLSKKGYKDYKYTSYIYTVIWELERIADDYRKICELMEGEKSSVSSEAVSLFADANSFFEDFYHLFYKFSQKGADSLTKAKNHLLKRAYALMQKRKGREAVLIHHLSSIITGTYDMAGQYYAMVI